MGIFGPSATSAGDVEVLIAASRKERVQDRQALDFRAASYNLLGASHTVGPRGRRGYAPASARLPQQVALLEHHGVSVAGLQEFQHPQTNHLARLRGKTYQSFPGLRLGDRLSQNSIIWRTDTWELIESRTTPIPYFGGRPVAMPHVLLRHRSSGRQVWFGNYHNPANMTRCRPSSGRSPTWWCIC